MQDLTGYVPEAPADGGFEVFKYNGVAVVNKAQLSENTSVDSEYYPMGCQQIDIEAEVSDEGSELLGRKLWKRFNLDSEKVDKKGKTPSMKLADQLFPLGLTFRNVEELEAVCEKLVGMDIEIKAYKADFKDGRGDVQMWNIKGVAGATESKPDSKATPAF